MGALLQFPGSNVANEMPEVAVSGIPASVGVDTLRAGTLARSEKFLGSQPLQLDESYAGFAHELPARTRQTLASWLAPESSSPDRLRTAFAGIGQPGEIITGLDMESPEHRMYLVFAKLAGRGDGISHSAYLNLPVVLQDPIKHTRRVLPVFVDIASMSFDDEARQAIFSPAAKPLATDYVFPWRNPELLVLGEALAPHAGETYERFRGHVSSDPLDIPAGETMH